MGRKGVQGEAGAQGVGGAGGGVGLEGEVGGGEGKAAEAGGGGCLHGVQRMAKTRCAVAEGRGPTETGNRGRRWRCLH